MKTGSELIIEERIRQTTCEGYDARRDDRHESCELADAAWCYQNLGDQKVVPGRWPWRDVSWKPTADKTRRFAKAEVLYQAEIDRLTRLRDECAAEIDRLQRPAIGA